MGAQVNIILLSFAAQSEQHLLKAKYCSDLGRQLTVGNS